jgi:branched-chain amino acid transport system ATP-binding protein
MSLLQLRGVTRRFGGLLAVDAVDLEVDRGGVSAIIGPNGAGKTTLFNMISGFLEPNAGSIHFEGTELSGLPAHRVAALGVVRTFQLVQLFAELTARQNVEMGRHLRTRGGVWAAVARPRWAREQERATREKASELLEFVGLAARADVAAGALTYGQQRLLEIARALAAEPKLLLLDEPAAGLNAQETAHLATTIGNITARGGVTVLLIDHDMNLVMQVAARIVVLDFGRKIAEGTPAEVQRNDAVIAAYLGTGAVGKVAEVPVA